MALKLFLSCLSNLLGAKQPGKHRARREVERDD